MKERREPRNVSRVVILCAAAYVAATLGVCRVATAASDGSVSGTVKLVGPAGARMEDVVVSIEGVRYAANDSKAPAPADLVLNQKDLTFVPHVLAVPSGATVTFRNEDTVLHNVHSSSTINPAFNFAMMKGTKKTVTFEHPEVVPIQCNVHSEMHATILVKDNPFFARPDRDGRFTIAGVPPGTYTVRAWHERAGTAEQPVTIAGGGTATANLALGADLALGR